MDYHLGDDLAQRSITWTDSFLGNGKGDVISGPFANWRMPYPVEGNFNLHRNLTVLPPTGRTEPSLMSDESIRHFLSARSLRDISWFVDPSFEQGHGAVHNWISGVMGNLPNSPADPVFFLHHAFIDCLWEQMRINQHRNGFDPRFDYPNDTQALGVGVVQPNGETLARAVDSPHYALNPMSPFQPLRNIDGLSNEYASQYRCSPSPRCTTTNLNCGSPYLFCDASIGRCAPKLQLGSDCSRFSTSDPCIGGICCRDHICRRSCSPRGNNNGILVNVPPSLIIDISYTSGQEPRPSPTPLPSNARENPRIENRQTSYLTGISNAPLGVPLVRIPENAIPVTRAPERQLVAPQSRPAGSVLPRPRSRVPPRSLEPGTPEASTVTSQNRAYHVGTNFQFANTNFWKRLTEFLRSRQLS